MTNIISVSGIDGSGKTTIIEALSAELEGQGRPVKIVWLRYNHYLSKIALAIGRISGLTVYEDYGDCRVGYHHFYRSSFLSHLFIWLTWFDTVLTSFFLVYIPVGIMGRTVICDRWIPDILIDLELDTHMRLTEGGFYHQIFCRLAPRSAMRMLVSRGYDAVYEVRPEHKHDRDFRKRFDMYQHLSRDPEVIEISNNGTVEQTLEQVRKVLRQ